MFKRKTAEYCDDGRQKSKYHRTGQASEDRKQAREAGKLGTWNSLVMMMEDRGCCSCHVWDKYIRWVISETVLGGKYLGVLIVPAVVIHSI